MTSGDLRCIGSTTFQEFRGIFEKDRAQARRFQKVDIPEPNVDDTIDILRGLKSRFEEHHNIEYMDDALKAAAELANRYINDRHMPDKAIDVIDEAGAYQRLQPEGERKKTIEVGDVENIVAQIARIPPQVCLFFRQGTAVQVREKSQNGGLWSGCSHCFTLPLPSSFPEQA